MSCLARPAFQSRVITLETGVVLSPPSRLASAPGSSSIVPRPHDAQRPAESPVLRCSLLASQSFNEQKWGLRWRVWQAIATGASSLQVEHNTCPGVRTLPLARH